MDKLAFLDVETSGLDEKDEDGLTLMASEIHSILELSVIIDIEGKMKDRITLKARPFQNDNVDPRSLEINGMDPEEIKTRPPQIEMLEALKEFLERHVDPYDKTDKLWIVAYNAEFDAEFLRALWSRHGDNYFGSYFWTPPLDIMQIIAFSLIGEDVRSSFPNFKLSTVASKLGIHVAEDKTHDSMYDTRLCRQLYYKLV